MRLLLMRFFWVMLAAIVIVTALGLALLAVTGAPPPLVLSMLPVVVASFDGGREYVRINKAAPGMQAGLTLTLSFFLVGAGLFSVVSLGGFASAGAMGELLAMLPSLALPLVLFATIWLVTIGVMIWFGARMRL
ncbi:MAG: ABZJ_00895 family protein [Rhodobacteraceae bacterium]|nr:ABZJ_00895 family protein [Paracoccaceae bacterium]